MAEAATRQAGGSRTTVVQEAAAKQEAEVLTLRLQGRQRLTWAEDVVDNEFMNKKKSNKC